MLVSSTPSSNVSSMSHHLPAQTNHHGHRHGINSQHNSLNSSNQGIRHNRNSSTQNISSENNSLFEQQRYQNNHAPKVTHHQMMQTTGIHNNQHIAGGLIRRGIQHQENDFPLRILVQSDMVGAIIGRSGSTIKQIINMSKARIDVHREENLDQQEKVITINGTPEGCSAACFKIIEIIQNEKSQAMNESMNNSDYTINANHDNSNNFAGEVQLKILAHNNLIGRLIGRNGASIKEIMGHTSTKINISVNSLTDCTNERTITVVGYLEQVRQAEQIISKKLRNAFMSDVSVTHVMNHQPYLSNNVPISYIPGPYAQNPLLSTLVNSQAGHGGHAMSRAMAVGSHQGQVAGPALYSNSTNYLSLYPNISVPAPHGLMGFNPAMTGLEVEKEIVDIYIPNSMVGAIIGKSGSAIKEMISSSGASIKVAAAPTQSESISTITPKEESSASQQIAKTDIVDDSNIEQTNQDPTAIDSHAPASLPNPHSKQSHGPTSNFCPSTRKVTIIGSPESQWPAQYLIYRKVSMENGKSDISLMVEIRVPSQLVGKIIGKGGVTVKSIQKQTRTTIRLPDEKPSSTDTIDNDAETCVQITGEFQNSQLAQRHIRNLIRDSLSSRQSRPHLSKNNENSLGKSNAQTNINDNHHRHRSDNESISTPDEIYEESTRLNEKNSIDVSTHPSDENLVYSESSSCGDNAAIPQGNDSQKCPENSPIENGGDRVNENLSISNNNTTDNNLNSIEDVANRQASPVKMKNLKGDDVNKDSNEDHDGIENSSQLRPQASD